MTDDEEYEISSEPSRDEQGHPVHPERGHRICGAVKSDRTTPTDHGRERDDYEYCLQPAGWGEDRNVGPCSNHPVTGEQWGESNPNYENGDYSEFADFMKESLTDREQEAMANLDLEESAEDFAKDVVKEAYLKYLRTGDDRFLREARQWASEFGVIEKPAEKLEHEHSGSIENDVNVPEHVSNAIASAAESNLKSGGDHQ
ncbi:4'-phosphopantetheinyl transferase family protein [Natronobacterium gregoryi]|uniref:Uncharacterized protein n=2 Tax=Natronobacterium gregoryi TaxID=44930 RepID=L0AMX1_NATGS|nr:4'-phosphopantetheinyl transferase superfamily protein [Natronobacterium gregoryi]AFZ74547.1 hypothetical protein Natgr_3428 [Natronobacterium gregoryi SP2]ELY72382.1 hypothetical protein C490_03523 [Natronobacterium gregoryi SP2]PLK21710.1 hypothetical protein CYV19_02415 [Natronobacterium gregoryi SP2]SFI96503.1 hypothetical protein SAMN05443661_110158 [Natronobacterium gregoryi]